MPRRKPARTKERRTSVRPKNGKEANPYIANEFKEQDAWRMFRIMAEFFEGFEIYATSGPP